MSKLGRQRLVALMALFAFLAACAIAPALALKARVVARQALSDENDLFRRLSAAQGRALGQAFDSAQAADAPAEAFIVAPTPGLATAQLEAYLTGLVGAAHAALISASAQQADRSDEPDLIRIQASIEVEYDALQALLYKLESGAPYVFVDSLTLRPAVTPSKRGGQDLPMRAILGLKAIWRQGST